jgi:hypothetical protein
MHALCATRGIGSHLNQTESLARQLQCWRPKVVLMFRLQHMFLIGYLVLSATACWVHAEPEHPHHEERHDHDEVIIHDDHHDHDHDHDHHD